MSTAGRTEELSILRQPRAVWAVAFACVIAFMGIGLVDPILPALAGASGTIGQIVGFRAGWGLGNALFIATALAAIVGSASGGLAGAIILYEAALGLGIAAGSAVSLEASAGAARSSALPR